MAEHLSGRHRDTLAKVFDHQAAHNIEWRQLVSLLESVGSVERQHNGKLKVTVGPETEVFTEPHGKDVEIQALVDLRRMLTEAGYAPGEADTGDEREGDYGDSRWGKPT